MSEQSQQDIQALAKGGRTNILGFVIRLGGTAPFLFIAARLYGKVPLGRFAAALVMIELVGQLCTLGQKRGLAQRLSEDGDHPANTVGDAMLLSGTIAVVIGALFWCFPGILFPNGNYTLADRLLVISILPATLTDVALSALAYRYDVATSVRSRAIVEPWTRSIAALALFYVVPASGLSIAYILSIWTAALAALWPLYRSYGLPRDWHPHPLRIWQLGVRNLPLAMADAVEWGTRKLDIFVLRFFVGEGALGVYYFAQQVATLPQKLKTSFEPILGPVITRNLREGNLDAIAKQVRQVGFWVMAAQAGIALALAIPGQAVMGLGGRDFVGGTGALAFLLIAEVVASTAVVSEAALVYVQRFRNLLVSLATIAFQALLTLAGIMWVDHLGLNQNFHAAAAAAALMVSLGTASLVKARMLGNYLQAPVNTWRWALIWAVAAAGLTGWAVTRFLPEWAELALGIPAILAVYCWVIWHKGFGPDDRVLFRKNVAE
ncbi:lipopolysaccharide biosynthesis protein [Novosphingobium sp. B 225]|uniref:lipopolysaccharide biosynthesis protein n=1 Tax=Novosphingobium sp. B 225 TaxID=1961849 RepID=UPI000B4A8DFA|nr:lipopolysaccharide biosynthesis protein [Novosphingobium sp. B 225]